MKPLIRTVHSLLNELVGRNPHKKLLGCPGMWLDAETVLSRTESIAWELKLLGIRQGTFVCLRTYRTVECCLVLFALQAIGAVAVLTDPKESAGIFLKKCEVPVPIEIFLELNGSRVHSPRGSFDIFQLPGKHMPMENIDPTEPSVLIFTSGTTGKSKAVMISQHNLIRDLTDTQPMGDYRSEDIALGALPMHHIFGLVLLTGAAVLGYSLYLPDRTNVPSLLEAIETQHITRMNGVPSLYLAMAEQAEQYDLSSLRVGFIAGSPWTTEQFCHIERSLGMTLISVYGMSECVAIACSNPTDPQSRRARGVGPFYPQNCGRIILPDGSAAPAGVEGEICVYGPTRMLGYYPQTMPETEYLHTGDLGYMDAEGWLYISGRKKDIIIRNGNNLSAVRIETALLSVSGVKDAAVVGIRDEKEGEVPWALVVCTTEAEQRLHRQLPGLLNKNELPACILRADALPRNAAGKVDKQKIREVLQWK